MQAFFIPEHLHMTRKLQFVVCAGSDGFAGAGDGSVENAAFRKKNRGCSLTARC